VAIDWFKYKGEIPGSADPAVFDSGLTVALIAGPRSWAIEAWVQHIRSLTGARVDWHWVAGRAAIKTLDMEQTVRQAIRDTIGELRGFAAARLDGGYELQGGEWHDC
jgi:hypothetical protein